MGDFMKVHKKHLLMLAVITLLSSSSLVMAMEADESGAGSEQEDLRCDPVGIWESFTEDEKAEITVKYGREWFERTLAEMEKVDLISCEKLCEMALAEDQERQMEQRQLMSDPVGIWESFAEAEKQEMLKRHDLEWFKRLIEGAKLEESSE